MVPGVAGAAQPQRGDGAHGEDEQGEFGDRAAAGGPGGEQVVAAAVQARAAVQDDRPQRQDQHREGRDEGGGEEGGGERDADGGAGVRPPLRARAP